MATKLPGIPSITSVQDTTVAAILRPMKESIEILGSAVTGSVMASGQAAANAVTGGSSSSSTTTTLDYTPPPAPTNVQASGAFSSIMVTWNAPSYSNHAYAEVWRSTTNVRGNATLVGFAPGSMYTDPVSVSTTFYYWVRFVSDADVAGPFNAVAGTLGKTAADSALVLGSLNSQITETHIAATLNTRLDKIEQLETTYGSTASAASSAATAIQAKTDALLAQAAAETAAGSAGTYATNANSSKTAAETAKASAETAATNAATSATTAATSASNAATSATTAANSATSAGNSATAAATSATNASTYATNAETASTASSNAKVAAESARDSAQTSATAAATSASTASTKASDAATSATSASTSATNAATSESNALTYKNDASSSASTATTKAADASTSAGAAATSATNASNSATAAASSASTASTKASDAAQSATAADSSKTAAATSASNAATSASNAATSETNASGYATAAATSLQQVQATATGFDAIKAWNFDSSTEGWSVAGMTQSVSGGVVTITSSSGDPIWTSPAALGVSGTLYPLVRARVRRIAGTSWQGDIYYSTAAHGYSESYKKTIADTTVTNQWRVLEWDMSALSAGGTDWISNSITQIRLDLGNSAADVFEVDWVTIGRIAPQATNAAIQQKMTARSSSDGTALAEYSVVTDLNGRVAGFGLGSEIATPSGLATTTFGLRADKFYIAPPTDFSQEAQPSSATTGQLWYKPSTKVTYRYNGSAWVVFNTIAPFIVQTTPTTVNGVAVAPGVYMDAAYIVDGSITNAKIGNLAVDDAKITAMTAAKLTAGNLSVDTYIRSTSFTSGVTGWAINANGSAEFNNITARGTINAISGSAGGITIDSTSMRSGQTAWNTGSGFYIGADGKFSLGQSGTKYLTWDGSQLNFSGSMQMGNITSALTGPPNAWGLVSLSPFSSIYGFGWNGTHWLALTLSGSVYYNSSAALSSSWVSAGVSLGSTVSSVYWNGSYWGCSDTAGFLYTNPNSNGTGTWTQNNVGIANSQGGRWVNSRWAVGGYMQVAFSTSSSGATGTWTSATVGAGTNALFNDINHNGTAWVAVSGYSIYYTTVSDGLSGWTSTNITPTYSAYINKVIWTGSAWIAVGKSTDNQQGLVVVNTNANASGTWAATIISTVGPIKDVTHDGINVVACTQDGSVLTNAGLLGASIWKTQKAGISYLNRVVWSGSVFATVGEQAYLSKAPRSVVVSGSGTSLNGNGNGDLLTGSASSYLGFDGTALYLNVPFIQTPAYLPSNSTLINQGGFNALSPGPIVVPDTTTVTVNGTWTIV